jgi:hypothetical protein
MKAFFHLKEGQAVDGFPEILMIEFQGILESEAEDYSKLPLGELLFEQNVIRLIV